MPEGPEIRRAADQLARAVVGKVLENVWFAFPELALQAAGLVGRRVLAIEPHGKALLTHFEGGQSLYSHNQLYGVWKVTRAGDRPQTTRSLRVALETRSKGILLYSASDIELWPTQRLSEHPFLAKLGPDVLDARLQPMQVAERLLGSRFRGRALSALLLDQSFLAGMGNYLRSEVLFEAVVAPDLRPRDLSTEQIEALADALLAVPRRSYATRGVARRRGARLRPDLQVDHGERFRFRVFDRAGEPCEACGSLLERSDAGGRRLYWCPRCQAC
ncbi:MAG: endonuclease VIII [Aquimonas sp.]|nr:endonuclease VIII [Aquimonas sp.]